MLIVSNLNITSEYYILGKFCTFKFDNFILIFIELFMPLNSYVVPFSLIALFNALIIVSLVRSRSRVLRRSTNSQNPTILLNKRDRKFAITIVLLNCISLLMVLPKAIGLGLQFLPKFDHRIGYYFYWLVFSYSGSVFYIQVAVNKLFRSEFCQFIGIDSTPKKNQNRAAAVVINEPPQNQR